ncbi:unnamed protein product [Microthlaspi erraticum]|uniref:Uncharacterized protein n=1 Tax=Microthlaspi erraticum TaxID=1685480 RepID=A0A6D2L0Q8_9BRAS|nr:unnamed protein product [Microthlaspi erraticum]
MASFREFQRQSIQQLRPNAFDQDDYNEFDVAVKIFESMELPNDTDFYWACIRVFREDAFWRSPSSGGNNSWVRLQVVNGVLDFNNGHTTKCSTMGHTTKCSTMGHNTKCSTMGHTTKFSTMEHTNKYFTMGSTTKYPTVEFTANAPRWGTPPNGQQ